MAPVEKDGDGAIPFHWELRRLDKEARTSVDTLRAVICPTSHDPLVLYQRTRINESFWQRQQWRSWLRWWRWKLQR